MKPAYHISLTPKEKRLITEIGAIQTQIEWLMRLTVQHVLKVSPQTALIIMGSTSIRANARIWISVIHDLRGKDVNLRAWADYAHKQIEQLSQGRNDFMHTLYGYATDGSPQGDTSFVYAHEHKPTKSVLRNNMRRGIRVRTSKDVPLSSLPTIKDSAASLSLVFAHIESETNPRRAGPSPWLHRFGSRLPPHPQTAKPKKGKAQKGQPGPSRP